MAKNPMTPQQALMRLEGLCARSEQCIWEISRKLEAWGIAATDRQAIIRSLVLNRYVDDERYATAFCRDKYRFSRWGRVKIKSALIQKHIDRDTIDDALTAIDEQEYEAVLIALLRAKSKTIADVQSYEGKSRLFRFGVSRGFEPALVIKTINSGQLWICEG